MHPLKRLLHHAQAWRGQMGAGTVFSVLNKFFDVLPELLIGVAVDVVVNRKESFLARMGLSDPTQQLVVLTLLTIGVWGFESLTEYLANLKWRNLAQNLQHALRMQ
ncbi:MAG: ABC transporter, partial [Myxococcales bacterium]|nr:ABC transporter [Myxococcales bacterium]